MIRIILMGGLFAAVFSCIEDKRYLGIDKNTPAPMPLNADDITVKNLPGRSVLFYHVPNDENLSYIKAVYTTAPGVTREAKASKYLDSLLVEGFSEAGNYEVALYSIGRNEKASDPIFKQVSPETPPIIAAWESLKLQETFGGVLGSFVNESKTPLTAVLMADTSHTGNFIQLRAFTLASLNAHFDYIDAEGLDTVTTDFKVYLRDHYGNISASKGFQLKPWFVEEIPKETWREYILPSDNTIQAEEYWRYGLPCLWDKVYNNENSNLFATSNDPTKYYPYHFTIDLGTKVMISAMYMHHRMNYEYINKTPKELELWGSEKNSPGDDLFGGDWFLLGTLVSAMPSGSTGSPTAEDKTYANGEGERLMIQVTDETPDPYRPVRFIRLRVLSVWDGGLAGQMVISEIDLFGQLVK
jgi:hypothetical protein